MLIDTDKVFEFSPTEYCEMLGKKLSDYKPKKVKIERELSGANASRNIEDLFREEVPDDAEVVVNFQIYSYAKTCCGKIWVSRYKGGFIDPRDGYYKTVKEVRHITGAEGTALVPKK